MSQCQIHPEIICRVCQRIFLCPPLSNEDILNGEELPDVCEECPYEYSETFKCSPKTDTMDELINNEEFIRLLVREVKKMTRLSTTDYEFPDDSHIEECMKKIVYMTISHYKISGYFK